ncbi:hypothetical protein TSUD_202180 [Trifolium subterraneum]|uniref:Fatty acid desaturase domain-containing protein n=1 Tax=Trifolium subterraneum TaxID=3900 RepID=A0A2Z6LKJ5_TRISU|nr:hypothetical protein TSUD_202180 [Trifolium subterraneum]
MACTSANSLLQLKGSSHHRPVLNLRTNIATNYSPGLFNLKSDGLIHKGFMHQSQKHFVPRNKVNVIRAVAIPVEPAPVESVEYRKQLAERYGFEQIGEPLPDNVTLKDVITSLPKKVFEIDDVKAWKTVLISATSYALGLLMISKAPWYLLPLAWAWTGTAVTGVGLSLQFEDVQTKRNKEGEDKFSLCFCLYGNWMAFNYLHDWNHGMDKILVDAMAGISLLEEWNAAQAQLNGTVHCAYPQWIEVLCHDINVHIPHHISPKIPSYNLRAAHKSLQENWGKYLNEASWNWRLMKTILTVCHVYDKEQNYVSFEEVAPEESHSIKFLKEVMPDYA